MRLYIIRHADPDYPNNTITPEGHLEAQALAKRLSSHGLDQFMPLLWGGLWIQCATPPTLWV